jgi:undecaprenyl phosphate N,N'-diacetylbacillosamine 1-phosphate transferase
MYNSIAKRFCDFSFALLGLIITSPILFLVACILLIVNQGSPFFIQTRPGKNDKPFRIVKFKTMNDAKDLSGNQLSDELRLTNAGAFIRKASLDELPQLWNVLKGDMSLVGPRPLLIEYLSLYNEEQKRRHDVRPGITGWAQVNGRNAISWKQKFEYDVWYVDNCSFALDMKILWMTVQKVFKREGISQEGQATVEKFNGNN